MPHDELKNIVTNSKTFKDVLIHFNLTNKGGNSNTLKKRLNEENIDFSHIKQGMNSNKGRKFPNSGLTLEECYNVLFINPTKYGRGITKKYLIKYSLIPYQCKCGLKNKWCNQSLSLHLEHKDGNGNNALIENLEFLCPNCHSQTKTFSGRKNKLKYFCKKCGEENRGYGQFCFNCSNFDKRKVNRPLKEELKKLLTSNTPYTTIGKMFGVSDNAVRKWAKSYDLI